MDRTPPRSIPASHSETRAREWAKPGVRQPITPREQPKPEPAATKPPEPRRTFVTVKPEPVVKTRTVYRDRPQTGAPTQAEIDRVLDHVFYGEGVDGPRRVDGTDR